MSSKKSHVHDDTWQGDQNIGSGRLVEIKIRGREKEMRSDQFLK